MSEFVVKELDVTEADGFVKEVELKLGEKSAEEAEGPGSGPGWSVRVTTTVETPEKSVVSTVA